MSNVCFNCDKELAESKSWVMLCDICYKKLVGQNEVEALTDEQIKKYYDQFLSYYYNAPCSGCPEGHSSFWRTICKSPEWKAWKATHPHYDFPECEELGIMSATHWIDFIAFVKNEVEVEVDVVLPHIPANDCSHCWGDCMNDPYTCGEYEKLKKYDADIRTAMKNYRLIKRGSNGN